jgi:hypothetical protein
LEPVVSPEKSMVVATAPGIAQAHTPVATRSAAPQLIRFRIFASFKEKTDVISTGERSYTVNTRPASFDHNNSNVNLT